MKRTQKKRIGAAIATAATAAVANNQKYTNLLLDGTAIRYKHVVIMCGYMSQIIIKYGYK